MTTATTKSTPAKATPSNVVTEKDNVNKEAVKPEETNTPDTAKTGTDRIPEVLRAQSILADFCKQYLSVYDEIAAYNKAVLAEKSSEWNAAKVMEKARSLARPTEKDAKPNTEIKSALDKFERLVTELNLARKAVLDVTSKNLGISLSAVSDRDPAAEQPLKDRRKIAVELGNQLMMIAKMTTDENASSAVNDFLTALPLPAVGRDQTRSFTDNDGKATPKYRVTVAVFDKDGNQKISEDGFTKAKLALAKFYPRGEGITSDKLREAWEAAGNNSEKTVVNPVEFDDNELHFVITKK
jgi:hypothetical protein